MCIFFLVLIHYVLTIGEWWRGGGAVWITCDAAVGDDALQWQIFSEGGAVFFQRRANFCQGEQIMSSIDQKFTINSVKKCRTGGDAGYVICSSGGMQNRNDAVQEWWRTVGVQDRRDVDRSNAGQEWCRKGVMKDRSCIVILVFIQRQVFTAYRKLLKIIHTTLVYGNLFKQA